MNTLPSLSSVDSDSPIYGGALSFHVVRLLSASQTTLVTFNSAQVDRHRFDVRQSHLAAPSLVLRIAELPCHEVRRGASLYGALAPLAEDTDKEIQEDVWAKTSRPMIATKIAAISTLIIVAGLLIGWILEHSPQS